MTPSVRRTAQSHSSPARSHASARGKLVKKGFLQLQGIFFRIQSDAKMGKKTVELPTSPVPTPPSPCPDMGCYMAELVRTTVKFTQNYPEIQDSRWVIITNSSPKAAITAFHACRPRSLTYPYMLPFPRFLFCYTIKWPPVKNNFSLFSF